MSFVFDGRGRAVKLPFSQQRQTSRERRQGKPKPALLRLLIFLLPRQLVARGLVRRLIFLALVVR